MKKLSLSLFFFLPLLWGCGSDGGNTETTPTETGEIPSWVPGNVHNAPWFGNLLISESEDGLTFGEDAPFLEHAGVPNLLRINSGQIIATYQYFSFEDEALFGIMTYSLSDDEGATWKGPFPILCENVPPMEGDSQLVDPSLVELEDGKVRLYFTIHPDGMANAHPASAIADSVEGVFEYEGPCITLAGVHLLDPAVIRFNDEWHYFTPKPGADGLVNLHAISQDGNSFTWVEEITLEMNMLGNPILFDGGIRFYGSGPEGVLSAFSSDGYSWTLDEGVRATGVDPGAVKRSDGSILLISTIRD